LPIPDGNAGRARERLLALAQALPVAGSPDSQVHRERMAGAKP
jgi:hypothetical protein